MKAETMCLVHCYISSAYLVHFWYLVLIYLSE